MGAVWVGLAALVLAGAFGLGYAVREWWTLAVPFVLPAGFAMIAGLGLIFEDRDKCYEACGFVWWFFYAVLALLVAAVLAGVIATGVAAGRRRRAAYGDRRT